MAKLFRFFYFFHREIERNPQPVNASRFGDKNGKCVDHVRDEQRFIPRASAA